MTIQHSKQYNHWPIYLRWPQHDHIFRSLFRTKIPPSWSLWKCLPPWCPWVTSPGPSGNATSPTRGSWLRFGFDLVSLGICDFWLRFCEDLFLITQFLDMNCFTVLKNLGQKHHLIPESMVYWIYPSKMKLPCFGIGASTGSIDISAVTQSHISAMELEMLERNEFQCSHGFHRISETKNGKWPMQSRRSKRSTNPWTEEFAWCFWLIIGWLIRMLIWVWLKTINPVGWLICHWNPLNMIHFWYHLVP